MNNKIKCVSFKSIMNQILDEFWRRERVLGIKKIYKCDREERLNIFNEKLELPIGPAAGPHTQLCMNIITSYLCGARYFELKTVQNLDVKDIVVNNHCIYANDEEYNVEWSTQLTAHMAMNEYIKAWFALKLLAKEFELGDENGFVFNMSVGYDISGIKSQKINNFIEGLKDATNLPIWHECMEYAYNNIAMFKQVDAQYIKNISPNICSSITLSTMHGCRANEIEKIVTYLLEHKKLNIYLKCNPTLLGYENVRKIMDDLGYEYLSFNSSYFKNDLQPVQAFKMFERLLNKAEKCNLFFGVKLTNTCLVNSTNNKPYGDEMYMSGRVLFPLAIKTAALISKKFGSRLKISYSGGADLYNIQELLEAGIWPVTVCTTLLSPMGYKKFNKFALAAQKFNKCKLKSQKTEKIEVLADKVMSDPYYHKSSHINFKQKEDTESTERHKCKHVCGLCEDVCPNRANKVIDIGTEKLILHLDYLCNECGNCVHFCPNKYIPYREKITVFGTEEDFMESSNQGLYYDKLNKKYYIRIKNKVKCIDDTVLKSNIFIKYEEDAEQIQKSSVLKVNDNKSELDDIYRLLKVLNRNWLIL